MRSSTGRITVRNVSLSIFRKILIAASRDKTFPLAASVSIPVEESDTSPGADTGFAPSADTGFAPSDSIVTSADTATVSESDTFPAGTNTVPVRAVYNSGRCFLSDSSRSEWINSVRNLFHSSSVIVSIK